MAFKMKGFNPGKGTGMGSSFLKKNYDTYSTKQRDAVSSVSGLSKDETTKLMDKKFGGGRRTDAGEKVKGGTKTWKEGMDASGGNLNELVKQRNAAKKGSDEYNKVQNQINKALGSKKTHGKTETSSGSKKTTSTGAPKHTKKQTVVPGVSEKTEYTSKRSSARGNTKTNVDKDLQTGETTIKSKRGTSAAGGAKTSETKFNADGSVKSRRKEKYGKKVTGAGDTGDYHSGRRKKAKQKTYSDDGKTVTISKTNDKSKTFEKGHKVKTRRTVLKGVGEKLGVGMGDKRKARRAERRATKGE